MELINKEEWFRQVMAEREQFFDLGITAVFLTGPSAILFWKCIPEGEGPWLRLPGL